MSKTSISASRGRDSRLRLYLLVLASIGILTFLAGFLQATEYNFLNYLAYAVLVAGGGWLMVETHRSNQGPLARTFLFATAVATTLIGVFYTGYEWFRLGGDAGFAGQAEGILYWLSLLFAIGIVGAALSIRRSAGSIIVQPK